MKINWPIGIILAFVAFVTFILSSIFMATREKIQLVKEDYYEEELKYQDIIDRKNNLKKLGKTITIVQKSDSVYVTFPNSITKGSIHFYKVNNASQDLIIPVNNTSNSTIGVNTKKMNRGLYTLKILWNSQNEKYYFEKTIRL